MNPAPTESPFERRWWRGAAVVICFASVVWLAIGFLVGAQVDDEEYWYSIPSSIIAAQGLWRGELDLWTSHFGLGVPQPFGQSLFMHPLTLLLAVMPVVQWVKLFYMVHLIVAACGI